MTMRNFLLKSSDTSWRGIVATVLTGCGAAVAIVFAIMAMIVMYDADT